MIESGQIRRWHPDPNREFETLVFRVIRRATAADSAWFGPNRCWWILRHRWTELAWRTEQDLLTGSEIHIPPAPGQIRCWPGATGSFMLVNPVLGGQPPNEWVVWWGVLGLGADLRFIDGHRVENGSELVSP